VHEIFTIGSDAIDFTVNPDGTVAYDPSLQGALAGAGTTELTIAGRTVSFDPTALGTATVFIDGRAFAGTAPFTVKLLPGQHAVGTAAGLTPATFTVGNDGTVGYDPSLQGALTGAGTATLTVAGVSVPIDPTALDEPTFTVDGTAYNASAVATVLLLPGGHYLQTNAGTEAFTVNADGTIAYDPLLGNVFSGAGTKTLTVLV
jgi:hypothetical protein